MAATRHIACGSGRLGDFPHLGDVPVDLPETSRGSIKKNEISEIRCGRPVIHRRVSWDACRGVPFAPREYFASITVGGGHACPLFFRGNHKDQQAERFDVQTDLRPNQSKQGTALEVGGWHGIRSGANVRASGVSGVERDTQAHAQSRGFVTPLRRDSRRDGTQFPIPARGCSMSPSRRRVWGRRRPQSGALRRTPKAGGVWRVPRPLWGCGVMRSNVIDIDVIIVNRTPSAIQVKDAEDAKAVWLPLSQIEVDIEGCGLACVTVPDWLAIEKELA